MVMSGMDLAAGRDDHDPGTMGKQQDHEPEQKRFYQYHATMMEPWDGPASILFSDGDVVGAVP